MCWAVLVLGYVAMVYGRYETWLEPSQDGRQFSGPISLWTADHVQPQLQVENWNTDQEEKPWRQGIDESKRALSVLSRWRPLTAAFASVGSPRRFTARSTADGGPPTARRDQGRTLLRPLGQPLRWGRR